MLPPAWQDIPWLMGARTKCEDCPAETGTLGNYAKVCVTTMHLNALISLKKVHQVTFSTKSKKHDLIYNNSGNSEKSVDLAWRKNPCPLLTNKKEMSKCSLLTKIHL